MGYKFDLSPTPLLCKERGVFLLFSPLYKGGAGGGQDSCPKACGNDNF